MFLFFIAVYLVIALSTIMLIWAMMVVAKWDDEKEGMIFWKTVFHLSNN